MKRILFFIVSMLGCLSTFAQELKVKSFTLDNDLEARTNPILDKEDNPCALVKMPMGDEIANVDGNVISIKDHYGEKWVYLTDGTKDIKIFHKRGISLRLYFPDYGIKEVMGKCTYVLDWEKTVSGVEPVMQQSQSLIIKYTPSTATVLVDNKMVRGNNGLAKTTLPVGQHTYIVACAGYESEEGMVKLKASAPSNLQITLTKEAASTEIERPQSSVNQQPTNNYVASASASSNSSGYSSASSSLISGSNTISIPVKDGISIEMVKVEAGTFMMGATLEMEDPWKDEKPVHQVTLTNDYYMGKYEVTQALWQAVMGSNPSKFKGDNLPVEMVSWKDCQKFISKLNKMTGKKFRLPTEAEWEYAARGGKKSRISDVAWYDGNSANKTHAVGTKQPNELGLYDMSGNVFELCQDWKGTYSSLPQTNPTGATSGVDRVCRGGSWEFIARYCRSSYRFVSSFRLYSSIGFRLVLSE